MPLPGPVAVNPPLGRSVPFVPSSRQLTIEVTGLPYASNRSAAKATLSPGASWTFSGATATTASGPGSTRTTHPPPATPLASPGRADCGDSGVPGSSKLTGDAAPAVAARVGTSGANRSSYTDVGESAVANIAAAAPGALRSVNGTATPLRNASNTLRFA